MSAPKAEHSAALCVCHPGRFDRYFQLVIPDDELSQREVIESLNALGSPDLIRSKLMSLSSRDLLPELIHRWSFADEIKNNDENKVKAFEALGYVSDRVPATAFDRGWGPEQFVYNVLLGRDFNIRREHYKLSRYVDDSKSLYLPCFILSLIHEGLHNPGAPLYVSGAEEDKKQLDAVIVAIASKRLKSAASDGSLAVNPQRPKLIGFWDTIEGGESKDATAWIDSELASSEAFIAFLAGFTLPDSRNADHLNAAAVYEIDHPRRRHHMLGRLENLNVSNLSEYQFKVVNAVKEILLVCEEEDARRAAKKIDKHAE